MVDAGAVLPEPAGRTVEQYLSLADRLLPGRVVGLYVVGSIALGAYRRSRSDIDLVCVVDGSFGRDELRRLRMLHVMSAMRTAPPALARGRFSLPGTRNTVFVHSDQLRRPVSAIVPVASHVANEFHAGRGFDVNPVVWKTFVDGGIAVRGAEPSALGLDPEPHVLRAWNRSNLTSYWKPWAEAALRRSGIRGYLTPRWNTAWGVLGAPRLHYTIATGDVLSKEQAGEYALKVFDQRWQPIIREALGYWRGEPADPTLRDRRVRLRTTAEFVLEVVRSAEGLNEKP